MNNESEQLCLSLTSEYISIGDEKMATSTNLIEDLQRYVVRGLAR